MKKIFLLIVLIMGAQQNFTQSLPLKNLLEGEYYQQVEALTQITEQNLREYLQYIEENVF